MKFVIQRVTSASVTVEEQTIGSIELGYLVYIGISESDSEDVADKMIKKLTGLRIFEDKEGKTNLSLQDVGGALLLISQFTLYADCKKGNRPSFTHAGNPALAERLYQYIIAECKKGVSLVQEGAFGANMRITSVNQGPFTVLLDSKELGF